MHVRRTWDPEDGRRSSLAVRPAAQMPLRRLLAMTCALVFSASFAAVAAAERGWLPTAPEEAALLAP